MKPKKNTRRLHYGATAAAFTAIVTVLAVVINIGLASFSKGKELQMDWTKNQVFQMALPTKRALDELPRAVDINVLTDEVNLSQDVSTGGYLQQANQMLHQMDNYSDNVTLTYTNLEKNPGVVAKHSNLNLVEGDILITSGERVRVVKTEDLFAIASDGVTTFIEASRAEQVVLSALIGVTKDNLRQAVFLTGLSQVDFHGLANLLSLNHFEVSEHSFLSGELPQGADILVLVAPAFDLSEAQADALAGFLANGDKQGKTLVYFAGLQNMDTPILDAFLADWGLAFGKSVVYETETGNLLDSQSPFSTLADYVEDSFSEGFLEEGRRLGLTSSRPVELIYESSGGRTTQALLTFSAASRLYPLAGEETPQPNPDTDPKGPFVAAAMSTRQSDSPEGLAFSQVIAIGSANSVEASYLATTMVNNSAYYVNLLQSLYGEDGGPVIEDKIMDPAQMYLTPDGIALNGIVFLYILPPAVFLAGLVEWLKRRRL